MASITRNLLRMIPFDGDIRSRLERAGRVIRRYVKHRQLRRSRYPWCIAAHHLRWALRDVKYLERWTEEKLRLEDNSWVFIAGCNNSGTTLLCELLDMHPSVRALPREGHLLTCALPTASRVGVPRLFSHRMDLFRRTECSDGKSVLRIKYDWSRYFEVGSGYLLARSPEDAIRTRWLQQYFKPSRFIAIVRSAYAVCEGTRRRSGHKIADAAKHWSRVNECLLSDVKHLQHCKFLKYEDFCEQPMEQLEEVRRFLNLAVPFPNNVLEAHRVHNIENRPSTIKNFNAKSLQQLSPDDIKIINDIAGPTMSKLGYDLLQKE